MGSNSIEGEFTFHTISRMFSIVIFQFGCCGIENYLDWEDVGLNPAVPVSCCREDHRMRGCSLSVNFLNPYESNKIIYVMVGKLLLGIASNLLVVVNLCRDAMAPFGRTP